jgi:hypothetical protein
LARGEQPDELEDILEDDGQYNNTIMMKILGPVVRFVDRPWKVPLVTDAIPHTKYLMTLTSDVPSRLAVWIR